MPKKQSIILKSLDLVERLADKLPEPFFLFAILAGLVLIISLIASSFGVFIIHPTTGEKVFVINLLDGNGIRQILTNVVKNFIEFPPLGIVLAAMIGIGVAERTGFLEAALRMIVIIVPKRLLTAALVFASVNSSLIADAGIVIMPTLGALLFLGVKRHPIAGLSAAFAGACGGFSANILITALDPLLSGFTQAAARMIDSSYNVYPTANYYFMVASVFLVTAVCTLVNDKFIEPRLGEWKSNGFNVQKNENLTTLSKIEKKGLLWASVSFCLVIVLLALMLIPEKGLLRGEGGSFEPFYRSIIPLIIILFFVSGLVYGIIIGSVRNNKDLAKILSGSMGAMGAYIVLAFAAGQFVAFFGWSNLGIVMAVKGADFLKGIGLTGIPLIMSFFVFSTVLNIFIYSASAKWAIVSPVFVPMLMLMGISPEATQVVYRCGDSITNIITPLLPYFPIVIVIAQKYEPTLTFGRLLKILMPYSIALFFVWGIFLALWLILGIPPGPDAPLFYFPK